MNGPEHFAAAERDLAEGDGHRAKGNYSRAAAAYRAAQVHATLAQAAGPLPQRIVMDPMTEEQLADLRERLQREFGRAQKLGRVS